MTRQRPADLADRRCLVRLRLAAVRHRLLGRPTRRTRPRAGRQSVDLRAVDRGLLHRLDVLRLGRPGGVRRRRVPDHLPRSDADVRARLGRPAQDDPHQQGQPHHLDRRLHLVALRQEPPAGRPGDDHRRHRHHAVHLAAAEGGGLQLHRADALSGAGPEPTRSAVLPLFGDTALVDRRA